MRFRTAVALIAAFVSTYDRGGGVHAAAGDEEPLLRRREQLKDEGSAGYVYEAGRADNDRRAAQEEGDSFYRYGTDYGTDEELGRYEYSKGSKGYSPAAAPVDSYGMKGGGKGGSKGDYYGDDDDGGKGWKGSKCKGSKGPKGHKGGYYGDDDDDDGCDDYAPYPMTMPPSHMMVPPAKPPMMKPSYEPTPVSPPTGCPDPDPPEKCLYDSEGKEYCEDPDLTCQKRCLPALCKVEPHGPPKYHDGHAYDPPTTYVPIGSTCKWWEYATSRGEPEICCELKEYSEYDPPGCGVCYDCQFPQVVNEACCAFYPGPPKHHDSENGSVNDRSGEYEGCPYGQVCCKCGSHSYKCIPDDDYHQCDETVCGIRPSPSPTPNPTAPPTPGPTPDPTPGPTPIPTGRPDCEISVNVTECVVAVADTVIPCTEFVPGEDSLCKRIAVFRSTVSNEGDGPITDAQYTSQAINQTGFVVNESIFNFSEAIEPGEPEVVEDPVELDFCVPGNVEFFAAASGLPGPCEDNSLRRFAIQGRPCKIEVENITCTIDGEDCDGFKDEQGFNECERNAQFKYDITNTGSDALLITNLTEILTGTNLEEVFDVIPRNLPPQELLPGSPGTEFIQETLQINLCTQGPDFSFQVLVEGDGGICEDDETFRFTIEPPTCRIEVDITCTAFDDGISCEDLISGTAQADEPPEPPCPQVEVTYVYTATNTGAVPLNLTSLIIDNGDERLAEDVPLEPEGSFNISLVENVDICEGFSTTATVKGDGGICEDTDTFGTPGQPGEVLPPPGNTEPPCILMAATGCDAGVRPGENGCCDEAHFCDPSRTCVECLGVSGVGCNSNDVDACCDEALMCGLNSDMSRVEENALPVEQRLSSDQCCVKNGLTGCRVGTNEGCCNYETAVGGYVCASVNNANDPGLGECCVPDKLPAPVTQGVRRADLCCSRSYDENGNCGVSA